jgi:hypothetical protein
VSYNASAVKIDSPTSSLVRFENKTILLFLDENAVLYYNAGVVGM